MAMQSNKRRLESCFYVNEVDIIGTECDLENIIGLYIGCQNWNLYQIGCLNSLPSYKFRFLIRAPFIRDRLTYTLISSIVVNIHGLKTIKETARIWAKNV